MNRRVKKFIHLLIVECNYSRQKIKEIWDRSSQIDVKFKYSLFIKDKYSEYKKQYPSKEKKEIMVIMKDTWKTMELEDKIKYATIEEKKQRKVSQYNIYFKFMYKKIKKENPTFSLGEISREIAQRWNQMTPQEKENISFEQDKIEKIKTVHHDMKEESNIVSTDFQVNDYFMGKGSFTEPQITRIKEMDPFLLKDDKECLEEICKGLSEKPLSFVKKMFTNNYDVPFQEEWDMKTTLNNIYRYGRRERILNRLEEYSKTISIECSGKEKEQINTIMEKYNSLEYWTLYKKYRNIFPNDTRYEIPKEEMMEILEKYHKDEICKPKLYEILGIVF